MAQLSISLRPRVLKDVIGQEYTKKEIAKRSKLKDFPSAILLKGMSGTGKSTVAQIIAMSINCTHPDAEGNPCGKCPSCKSIIEERFDRDTSVLDGSQIGQKGDVTEFTQLAGIAPMYDKARVLIIEEADQLSSGAKNALHKILEKPRDNVHFILLSMVNNGIPSSIQSRCQSYTFKPLSISEIATALKGIMENKGLWDSPSIPDSFKLEGLITLSRASRGSLREAIQYLERCITGDTYEIKDIREQLNIVDESSVNEALNYLLSGNIQFFSTIENMDITDFFNISYSILSDALVYSLTKIAKDDWQEEALKQISSFPRLRELLNLYDDLSKYTYPYIKKALFFSKICLFFKSNSTVASRIAENQTFMSNQAKLDAEAQARSVSIRGSERDSKVETMGLGPQTQKQYPVR